MSQDISDEEKVKRKLKIFEKQCTLSQHRIGQFLRDDYTKHDTNGCMPEKVSLHTQHEAVYPVVIVGDNNSSQQTVGSSTTIQNLCGSSNEHESCEVDLNARLQFRVKSPILLP